MQDRISTYPGRVRLIPVSGQENVYDLVRADQPTQEGTPLSKGTLLTDDVAISLGIDPVTGTVSKALGAVRPIEMGGTSGTTRTEAFNNIVAPGGAMTGGLAFNKGFVPLTQQLSDGTKAGLILRNASNNLWIGATETDALEKQGDVFLSTDSAGNAYVSRNNVRSKIFDEKSIRSGFQLDNATPITALLADGTSSDLVRRAANGNVFLGTHTSVGNASKQGNAYLCVGATGDAYVNRTTEGTTGTSKKILDYGIVGKSLWSGSWAVGDASKTIAGISEYTLFVIKLAGEYTPLYAIKNGSKIRGGGLYATASNNWVTAIGFSVSGNTLTFDNVGVHSVSLSTGAVANMTVNAKSIEEIIGIV